MHSDPAKETRVLYLAAHPDDENTRLISLTHGAGVETASVPDKGKRRTEPDRANWVLHWATSERKSCSRRARSTAGVNFSPGRGFWLQQESRGNLCFWGKEEVLSDVVRVIREFRPHIIITRFPTDGRGGHGHLRPAHFWLQRLSIWLDPSVRFLTNTEFHGRPRCSTGMRVPVGQDLARSGREKAGIIEVEVGGFDPVNGRSCNELASMSRACTRVRDLARPLPGVK